MIKDEIKGYVVNGTEVKGLVKDNVVIFEQEAGISTSEVLFLINESYSSRYSCLQKIQFLDENDNAVELSESDYVVSSDSYYANDYHPRWVFATHSEKWYYSDFGNTHAQIKYVPKKEFSFSKIRIKNAKLAKWTFDGVKKMTIVINSEEYVMNFTDTEVEFTIDLGKTYTMKAR